MRIHTVETEGDAADLTTGNVSLRTVNGSLVDGKDDGTANVLGQSIDLDANGGSIGSSGNDLEIDSARGSNAPCTSTSFAECADASLAATDPGLSALNDDVALEATESIYLTEVDAHLRLVFAHAVNGDIRITVRESSQHDEDLYLC